MKGHPTLLLCVVLLTSGIGAQVAQIPPQAAPPMNAAPVPPIQSQGQGSARGPPAPPAQPRQAQEGQPPPSKPQGVPVQQAQPIPAQPMQAQPVQPQPVQAQPVQVQPVQAQPVQAQPVQAQFVNAQPVQAQPVQAQFVNAQIVEPSAANAYAVPPYVQPAQQQAAHVAPQLVYPPSVNAPAGGQHAQIPNIQQGNIPLYQNQPYVPYEHYAAHPQYGAPAYGYAQAVNVSHGPVAPQDLSPEQMRELAAAQGLYQQGESQVAQTGDTAAQWEALMADFVPDMIVTFKLAGGSTEHFHQEVGPEPVLIRGGFFESMTDSGSAVSFTVISPQGKIAYLSRTGEGVFKFETKEPGQYTFAVHNAGWLGAKYVTFVVGAGMAEGLTQEDVDSLDGNIKMLYRMLYDMETQASYTWRRMKSHLEGMSTAARHTYYALLAQLCITGLATIVQLNIIKRMVSHRRMF
eukprot:Blabericola_migrator_1__5026@NODE_2606_length_2543_cov_3124_725767_g1634_i0_p1_GENE_NODE_2606_length_2543_cov_3124_725767_g1634_i0NODE_2606_length_2543_cov_3124_725767_g1634_i0_p1_ORF_typecomplete_len461_score76_98EMP24_GP25L/PF01105_24/8e13Keratin_B2_2/PF13885_6/14_NODE_2606_length_2543_cov_3124_725767_g1634_i04511833